MDTIVRENDIYVLQTGECILETGKYLAYQIINKQYGVVEAETTVLPQALDWFESFTRSLRPNKAGPEAVKDTNKVVSIINKDDSGL